jgi:CheY-like chemotaxis protein
MHWSEWVLLGAWLPAWLVSGALVADAGRDWAAYRQVGNGLTGLIVRFNLLLQAGLWLSLTGLGSVLAGLLWLPYYPLRLAPAPGVPLVSVGLWVLLAAHLALVALGWDLRRRARALPGAPERPADAQSSPRLLIVDDTAVGAEVWADDARRAGWTVHVASTLAAARAALGATSYDVVLLDRMLPDGSGLVLLDELRALAAPPRVILASAFWSPAEAATLCPRFAPLGVVKCLPKPLEREALRAVLREQAEAVRGC